MEPLFSVMLTREDWLKLLRRATDNSGFFRRERPTELRDVCAITLGALEQLKSQGMN